MKQLSNSCDFATSIKLRDIPSSAIDRAQLALMDTFGVMIAGSLESRAQKLAVSLQKRGSSGRSTFLTNGVRGNSVDAALVNAVCSCLHVEDESHKLAYGHPATYVLPSVLAVAEEREASAEELFLAFIAGYEVTARLGIAWGWRKKNMHPSGIYGPIGGAAGVAMLMKFTSEQMRVAMNLAAPLTSASSWQSAVEGATVRDLFSGQGAALAVQAPLWVEAGFTAAHDDVSNVLGNISGDGFDASAVDAGLGTLWEIERNSYKIHACCGNIMSGIEASIALKLREKFRADEIKAIHVATYRNPATLNNNPDPLNVLSAKESFPVSLALALNFGTCGREVYTDENVRNNEVRRLAYLAKIELDPELDAMTPMKRPSRVTVTLQNGRELSEYLEAPINAMPPIKAIHDKFFTTVSPVIGDAAAGKLQRAIYDLPNGGPIGDLTTIIRQSLHAVA